MTFLFLKSLANNFKEFSSSYFLTFFLSYFRIHYTTDVSTHLWNFSIKYLQTLSPILNKKNTFLLWETTKQHRMDTLHTTSPTTQHTRGVYSYYASIYTENQLYILYKTIDLKKENAYRHLYLYVTTTTTMVGPLLSSPRIRCYNMCLATMFAHITGSVATVWYVKG